MQQAVGKSGAAQFGERFADGFSVADIEQVERVGGRAALHVYVAEQAYAFVFQDLGVHGPGGEESGPYGIHHFKGAVQQHHPEGRGAGQVELLRAGYPGHAPEINVGSKIVGLYSRRSIADRPVFDGPDVVALVAVAACDEQRFFIRVADDGDRIAQAVGGGWVFEQYAGLALDRAPVVHFERATCQDHIRYEDIVAAYG